MTLSAPVLVQISPGELLDKISILLIKMERLADPQQRENVEVELGQLQKVRVKCLPDEPGIEGLFDSLKSVNDRLWHIEDDIRDCERETDFGPRFVELARSVYINNDERARIKRQINEQLGSTIVEEKSYQDY